ncbi:nucleoside hydrolase [Flammeovirga yaeyamensis]|uniref:Nucleoside hydrolase n=1 Tax=Flammeovirga yaeyamensis TaxID=367791 RepID=A0AAX1N719_9BACT|nr:nucleoside hydrolase [Flammeovirga yaeyamensis]MBB3697862.1 inosine-uridine nucleoside N-ribohydrolase [Flammeovirga yaeyamensis]NMF35783.1 nucleoside hydrolase [Flammeovirga yaeyamensis]QWG03265.1 nucleoside hydrolase [Flammeovirga yaeyamensis]
MKIFFYGLLTALLLNLPTHGQTKTKIIFDTDTNNEVDDQNALAYLLLNDQTFDVLGVTVNATRNGGNVTEHYKEAERIITLCDRPKTKLIMGVNDNFDRILPDLNNDKHDGYEAVDFIIKSVKKYKKDVVILAVGKLTNVALAMAKDPSIINDIRIVWLGTNYPNYREYNFVNDIPSMNYIMRTNAHFEIMPCRYNMESGTAHVKVYKEAIVKKMKGMGPTVNTTIIGRHGGEFSNLGDYLSSLFEHIEYYHNPPSRSLFDMVAVAVIKNNDWAERSEITPFIYENERWNTIGKGKRKVILWEFFDAEAIMDDFYKTLNPQTK